MQTLFLLFTLAADPVPADIVIQNATIYDGTGKVGSVGDVAIAGDKIVAVGKFAAAGKPRVIDGTGLIVAPGFIDLHTHCDSGSNSVTQPGHRINKCYLTQGVTTVITGNCGAGPVDVKAFYEKLDKNGVGTNVTHLVPHNAVRTQAMGNANRQPTEDELHKDGSPRRCRHEGRRLGPGHRPHLHAGHLCEDRRDHRSRQSCVQESRHLRQPHSP